MRRTLILVLSAFREPWGDLLTAQRKTWDSVWHPTTSTLYYCGASDEPQPEYIFTSVHNEAIGNIGRRTQEAFKHALTRHDWEFMARVHSSCYVHKRRMAEFIDTLPERDQFRGLVAGLGDGSGREYLWGGGHFILSRDVVERLVEHEAEWDHGVMEDVAMSFLAQKLGIPFSPGRMASINEGPNGWDCIAYNGKLGGLNTSNFADFDKLDDQFFFRVKHDLQRHLDIKTMELLHKHLTP